MLYNALLRPCVLGWRIFRSGSCARPVWETDQVIMLELCSTAAGGFLQPSWDLTAVQKPPHSVVGMFIHARQMRAQRQRIPTQLAREGRRDSLN